MKTDVGRSSSPSHVHHEQDSIPLHVNAKKKKKRGVPSAIEERIRHSHKRLENAHKSSVQTTHVDKSSKSVKEKRSPHVFIPPPGKTSTAKKNMTWEGGTHRLDVSQRPVGILKSSLHLDDIDSSEDEKGRSKVRLYEKTIGNLMEEIGTLRDEVGLQESRQIKGRRIDDHLNASKAIIEEQEDEILDYREELRNSLSTNRDLKTSMEMLREDADRSRSEVEVVSEERDVLVRKLVEAEMGAKSTGRLVEQLRDTVDKLREDRRMSSTDVMNLIRQKEAILRKLSDFEETNKALRKLLKEQSLYEGNEERLRERHDVLLQRLTGADEENKKLTFMLREREKEVEALAIQVEADKNQAVAFQELKKTMEATRGHLQKELRSREMECERLCLHVKTTNEQAEQDRTESEHMRGLMEALREKSHREKDALKKAARIQKDRATESEKIVVALEQKLDKGSAEAQLNEDVLKDKLSKCKKEKSSYDSKIDKLKSRIEELAQLVEHTENTSKANQDSLTAKLKSRINEINTLRADNERLKMELEGFEDRLKAEEQRNLAKANDSKMEVDKFKRTISDYEKTLQDSREQTSFCTEEKLNLQEKVNELESKLSKLKIEAELANEEVVQLKHTVSEYENQLAADHKVKDSNTRSGISELQSRKKSEQHFTPLMTSSGANVTEGKNELHAKIDLLEHECSMHRKEIDKYRRDAEDARTIAEEKEQQLERVRQEGQIETEKVRIAMQQRIAELEPVSELFKASELRLQDSQGKMLDYERRASDHKQLISELTQKVEMQSDQLEEIREKWRSAIEYNKQCEQKFRDLERKYDQMGSENRELIATAGRREEASHQMQEKLSEKKEMISKLTYQLEAALADARRQAETQREKAVAKERASQARIADLEAQLSRSTANSAQMKKEKDEVERRFSSRLNDMRDRLEQANSTTRSMQNYVSFLKSSYSTVFDDLDDAGRHSPR